MLTRRNPCALDKVFPARTDDNTTTYYPAGAIAQLVERVNRTHEVRGSNPRSSTPPKEARRRSKRRLRASVWGAAPPAGLEAERTKTKEKETLWGKCGETVVFPHSIANGVCEYFIVRSIQHSAKEERRLRGGRHRTVAGDGRHDQRSDPLPPPRRKRRAGPPRLPSRTGGHRQRRARRSGNNRRGKPERDLPPLDGLPEPGPWDGPSHADGAAAAVGAGGGVRRAGETPLLCIGLWSSASQKDRPAKLGGEQKKSKKGSLAVPAPYSCSWGCPTRRLRSENAPSPEVAAGRKELDVYDRAARLTASPSGAPTPGSSCSKR